MFKGTFFAILSLSMAFGALAAPVAVSSTELSAALYAREAQPAVIEIRNPGTSGKRVGSNKREAGTSGRRVGSNKREAGTYGGRVGSNKREAGTYGGRVGSNKREAGTSGRRVGSN